MITYYRIVCDCDPRIYVGSTIGNPKEIFEAHMKSSWASVGKEHFKMEIIETADECLKEYRFQREGYYQFIESQSSPLYNKFRSRFDIEEMQAYDRALALAIIECPERND